MQHWIKAFQKTSVKLSNKLQISAQDQANTSMYIQRVDENAKAELLQEGIFFLIHLFARDVLVMKKLEIKKTKPNFIISVLKVLVSSISNCFTNKTSLANKWMSFSSRYSALSSCRKNQDIINPLKKFIWFWLNLWNLVVLLNAFRFHSFGAFIFYARHESLDEILFDFLM